jgi:hypothetical protein
MAQQSTGSDGRVHRTDAGRHAAVAGIADRTGSLTPGKKADIVILDGKAVNMAPIIDPVGAVVCAADISNVKTVLVDGEVMKEDGKLKADLSSPRTLVEESRDYLLSKFGGGGRLDRALTIARRHSTDRSGAARAPTCAAPSVRRRAPRTVRA